MLFGLKKEGDSEAYYHTDKPEHLLLWYPGGSIHRDGKQVVGASG